MKLHLLASLLHLLATPMQWFRLTEYGIHVSSHSAVVCLNMAIVMRGPVVPQSPFTHALNSNSLLKGG